MLFSCLVIVLFVARPELCFSCLALSAMNVLVLCRLVVSCFVLSSLVFIVSCLLGKSKLADLDLADLDLEKGPKLAYSYTEQNIVSTIR